MTELYLILHKVRGEPAFDIAQRMQIGNEEGWIIPTSGHRAYPASAWQFNGLRFGELDLEIEAQQTDLTHLPDHYDAKRDDGANLVAQARDILMRKGRISAAKPATPTFRRA